MVATPSLLLRRLTGRPTGTGTRRTRGCCRTRRKCQIYKTLGAKVRGAGLDQLLRAFFPDSASGRIRGKHWLKERERAGLFESFTVLARPVEDVELVCYGDPRAPPPDFSELSRESARRWNVPCRPTTVIHGTAKLRNIVGGPPRMGFRAMDQIGHDALGVAAVYFKLLRTAPELAAGWACEDSLLPSGYREAQPDAVIFDQAGSPRCAIEFASGYQAKKFEKIDRTFRSMGIPYTIWMRTET